jgi:hypothetical protein
VNRLPVLLSEAKTDRRGLMHSLTSTWETATQNSSSHLAALKYLHPGESIIIKAARLNSGILSHRVHWGG